MNSLSIEKKARSFRRTPDRQAVRRSYDRESQLPKLIGLWPSELRDYSLAGTARIVALLHKAIRSERQRAQGGHWSYDLNRHLGLAEALKAERSRLRELEAEIATPSNRSIGAKRGRKRLRLISQETNSAHKASADVFLRATRRVQLVSDADG